MENKKDNVIKSKSRVMTLTIKAVVINKNKEVLVLKRAKNSIFSPGRYDLPGGHVEENEGLEESVKREVKEETGLDVAFGVFIDVVEFSKDSPQFKAEKRGIRCICYSDSSEVKLSEEHESFEWVPFDKIVEKFSLDNGFENEKRETILKAQKYIEKEEALDGWKRCLADFENYKKRQAESQKEMINFMNLGLIEQIIPVLDNFHASTDHIPEDQKDNAWVVGIMYIQKQLEKVLEDNGVVEIKTNVGDDFNPRIHEAISNNQVTSDKKQVASEDKQENKVKKIVAKGYEIDGKVVRPTRVIVE